MTLEERTLESEILYRGKVLNLRIDKIDLGEGRTARREIVEHAPAVAVVALDEEGRVLLVRQYRKAVERFLDEIPAGSMDPGEEPIDAARRELAEETGYRARNWRLICSYFSAPGFAEERMHLFQASGMELGETDPDEDEIIEVIWRPLEEAYKGIFSGDIQDSKTIIGLQHLYFHRD